MKKNSAIIIFTFLSTTLTAQMRYDNNWIFNLFYGFDVNNNHIDSGAVLQFHPSQTVNYHNGGRETYIMNASFSDKNGNLLFYTNGCVLLDKNHQLILGGDSINYGSNQWGDCLQGIGYANGPQGAIFIPKPESEDSIINLFHLFGETIYDTTKQTIIPYTFEIRKTEISLIKNKWIVTNKNKTLIRDTLSFKGMVSTKHSNNKDWWILIPDGNYFNIKNKYLILKYTEEGITEIKTQIIGDLLTGTQQCNFSPDGTKYALYNWVETYVCLSDFDKATGTLSNYRKFNLPDTLHYGGCAFSPDSRFLYVTTALQVWQYDTKAADIDNSRVLVAVNDGFKDSSNFNKPFYFWQIQQGPDCKLYINSFNFTKYLSYINKPNEKGVACDVRQHAIRIRTGINNSMPYFPNYRLGTPYENDCDTITGISWLEPYIENEKLTIIPNPSQGSFEVKNLEYDEITKIQIYNITGKLIQEETIPLNTSSLIFENEKLESGMYIIHQKSKGKIIKTCKLVVVRSY